MNQRPQIVLNIEVPFTAGNNAQDMIKAANEFFANLPKTDHPATGVVSISVKNELVQLHGLSQQRTIGRPRKPRGFDLDNGILNITKERKPRPEVTDEQRVSVLKEVGPVIEELKAGGLNYGEVGRELNNRGLKSFTGAEFSPLNTSILHKLYQELPA